MNQPDSLIPSNGLRQLIAIIAILLLAIAGLNLDWGHDSKYIKPKESDISTMPDAIVGDPLLEIFDNSGKRVRQINGEQIQFFDAEKRNIITSPKVYFEEQSEDSKSLPWIVTANTATVYQSDNKIDLQGNVLLSRSGADNDRTDIATEQLFIDTSRQFAETNKAVTISSHSSKAQANGMQADLANKRLGLLSRVKEIHEVRR